ncbi:hypothetical protein CJ030_MR5G003191 [Morella rubra]|uniref:Uncharacterized protein n=1 Tax=Morella rubra TaxID=262757 RepID=A0A6A1VNK4_9ROSI|nr:hypothetical protein CJ030_MR5G003191 [Morella rubra]
MAQETASVPMYVDDFYFSVLADDENKNQAFLVSDAKYAEELQFQEVMMGSLINFPNGKQRGLILFVTDGPIKSSTTNAPSNFQSNPKPRASGGNRRSRCSFQFCYGCGEKWTDDHGGCARD